MNKTKSKFKFKMPHAYVLIVGLIILVGILTYIVPAGIYEKVEIDGRSVIDPASYHTVEQTPVSPWEIVMAIPQGLVARAGIIFMIMVIAGSIEIIKRTGALEASIGKAAKQFKDRLYIVLPLLLLCFVALGAVGVGNAIIAFIPLGLLIAFNLGADACVGVGLVGMGMNLGFTAGPFTASTVGTAHAIIGLPIFSGFQFRIVLAFALWVAGSIFLIRYVKKIQNDPTQSAVYGVEEVVTQAEEVEMPILNSKRKLVLVAFLIGFGFIVYAAVNSWSAYDAIPSIFLLTGVICGLIHGFGPSEIAKIFVEGAKKLTFGALIVGISGGIAIVMTKGQIIHTVVQSMASLMIDLPLALAAMMMFVGNIIINFFITSGSGQAATIIPILSPVGDVVGFTQQTVVLAFQLGDGFTNQILPMSSVTMAQIAMGGIPYNNWIKFVWKWILLNFAVGAVFLILATIINYGPF